MREQFSVLLYEFIQQSLKVSRVQWNEQIKNKSALGDVWNGINGK